MRQKHRYNSLGLFAACVVCLGTFSFQGCSSGINSISSNTGSTGVTGGSTSGATGEYLYVGSFAGNNPNAPNAGTNAIYAYSVTPGTGALTPLGLAASVGPLAKVQFDATHNNLYTFSEYTGIISGYNASSSSGSLVGIDGFPISTGDTYDVTPTYFSLPGYLILDGSDKFLRFIDTPAGVEQGGNLFPTYFSSTVTVYNIGSATPIPSLASTYTVPPDQYGLGQTEIPTEQFVVVDPSGRFAYSPAGLVDGITAYTVNSTTGVPTSSGTYASTCDAQGIVFDPQSKFLFCPNNNGTVLVYTINASTGALTLVSAYPAPGITGSPMVIDPKGRFLYAANGSGYDIFTINLTTGALSLNGTTAPSQTMFDLTFDPTGDLAFAGTSTTTVNSTTNSIASFTVNGTTGGLTQAFTYGAPTSAGVSGVWVAYF